MRITSQIESYSQVFIHLLPWCSLETKRGTGSPVFQFPPWKVPGEGQMDVADKETISQLLNKRLLHLHEALVWG